jgi:hypothetical protein
MGSERLACIAGELVQDFVRRFGPDKRLGSRVGNAQELLNGLLELAHAAVSAAFNLPLRQECQPSLRQIEPGAVSLLRKMQCILWLPRETRILPSGSFSSSTLTARDGTSPLDCEPTNSAKPSKLACYVWRVGFIFLLAAWSGVSRAVTRCYFTRCE